MPRTPAVVATAGPASDGASLSHSHVLSALASRAAKRGVPYETLEGAACRFGGPITARIERLKKLAPVSELNPSRSPSPAISLQSAKLGVMKSDSTSVGCENRTKSAESGGFETKGSRERISSVSQHGGVRRFVLRSP